MEFCNNATDSKEFIRYEVTTSHSPGSPDRQYCSSTTQSLGDPHHGHTEVNYNAKEYRKKKVI